MAPAPHIAEGYTIAEEEAVEAVHIVVGASPNAFHGKLIGEDTGGSGDRWKARRSRVFGRSHAVNDVCLLSQHHHRRDQSLEFCERRGCSRHVLLFA